MAPPASISAVGRERGPDLRVVDVSVHGHHAAVALQLAQHGKRAQVAGVQDQVGRPQPLDAGGGQPAGAAGQVGVGDDRDPHGGSLGP